MAELWVEQINNIEMAELTVMNLFQKLSYAPSLSFKWIADEREFIQTCGFLTIARLLGIKGEMNDRAESEFLDQAMNYKPTKTLIQYLVKAAGRNANLLLNIGPQPNGELPDIAVQRLQEMGEWTKQYGETIYGTRGGLIPPQDWGVTTQKNNKLFVHILNLKSQSLYLPLGKKKVVHARIDYLKRQFKIGEDRDSGAYFKNIPDRKKYRGTDH